MIKQIGLEELAPALELVNRVFAEFVAVDYSERGNRTFADYLTHKYDEMAADLTAEHKRVWGYYLDGRIVGVIASRGIAHVALLYVDKRYHRRGIAKALFAVMLEEVKKHDGIASVTVNSSPYAVEIYKRLGFAPTDGRQEKDGLIYYPMERKL